MKQQIVRDLHNDYVEVLVNENDILAQTTTLELLNQLHDSYGIITPRKMEDTTNATVKPYDPSKTTIKLFV